MKKKFSSRFLFARLKKRSGSNLHVIACLTHVLLTTSVSVYGNGGTSVLTGIPTTSFYHGLNLDALASGGSTFELSLKALQFGLKPSSNHALAESSNRSGFFAQINDAIEERPDDERDFEQISTSKHLPQKQGGFPAEYSASLLKPTEENALEEVLNQEKDKALEMQDTIMNTYKGPNLTNHNAIEYDAFFDETGFIQSRESQEQSLRSRHSSGGDDYRARLQEEAKWAKSRNTEEIQEEKQRLESLTKGHNEPELLERLFDTTETPEASRESLKHSGSGGNYSNWILQAPASESYQAENGTSYNLTPVSDQDATASQISINCPICTLVYCNPHVFCRNDQHVICETCTKNWEKEGRDSCPICGERGSATPNAEAQEHLGSVLYYCPNKGKGCQEKIPLKNIEKHIDNCLYAPKENEQACAISHVLKKIAQRQKEAREQYLLNTLYTLRTMLNDNEKSSLVNMLGISGDKLSFELFIVYMVQTDSLPLGSFLDALNALGQEAIIKELLDEIHFQDQEYHELIQAWYIERQTPIAHIDVKKACFDKNENEGTKGLTELWSQLKEPLTHSYIKVVERLWSKDLIDDSVYYTLSDSSIEPATNSVQLWHTSKEQKLRFMNWVVGQQVKKMPDDDAVNKISNAVKRSESYIFTHVDLSSYIHGPGSVQGKLNEIWKGITFARQLVSTFYSEGLLPKQAMQLLDQHSGGDTTSHYGLSRIFVHLIGKLKAYNNQESVAFLRKIVKALAKVDSPNIKSIANKFESNLKP